MSRDHFSKIMQSPYFQSAYYQEETNGGKCEKKIENFFKRIMKWRSK
jgi:hypothetical protein